MDAVVGFIIVLFSFFTLPVQFLKRSWDELSGIGRKHSVDVDGSAELPFLNWLLVLGRSIIAIFAILFYIFLIIAAASAKENAGSKVVLAIIFGPLLSFAFIWFYGMLLEFISLQILVAKNTRLTYEALRGNNASSTGPSEGFI